MSADPFPIHPTAVQSKNFRGWLGKHELRLGPGLTLLVGENASGKSSALNAIEWGLFGGEVARKGSGIDERGDWEIRNRAAQDEVMVVLTLAVTAAFIVMIRPFLMVLLLAAIGASMLHPRFESLAARSALGARGGTERVSLEEARAFGRRYLELLRAKYPDWSYGREQMDANFNFVEINFENAQYNIQVSLVREEHGINNMWRLSMGLGWQRESTEWQAWQDQAAIELAAEQATEKDQIINEADIRGL